MGILEKPYFRGQSVHRLDAKGRLRIPNKFREILQNNYTDALIITLGDNCLRPILRKVGRKWRPRCMISLRCSRTSGLSCGISYQALKSVSSITREEYSFPLFAGNGGLGPGSATRWDAQELRDLGQEGLAGAEQVVPQ